MTQRLHAGWLLPILLCCLLTGCAVGQRPGQGQKLRLTEQASGGSYWLYLPEGYDEETATGHRFPLVMTFHGMKPFDNAHSQIREWQQEADRYGYVVCAPELLTPDLMSPLPLGNVTGSLKVDERRILAIMDELARTTNIDPNHTLVTSWSYGGYVAHYMANHYPERFSCLCVKQSNFSEAILDPQQVRRYRNYKVGIFYTENDFKICRVESEAAARWYNRHGFDVKFAVFQDLGHERRPSVAAAFFAQNCDATPKTPPVELARLQIKELPPPSSVALAAGAGRPTPLPPVRRNAGSGQVVADASSQFEDSPRSATNGGKASTAIATRSPRQAIPGRSGRTAQASTGAVVRTKPVPLPPKQDRVTPPRPTPAVRSGAGSDRLAVRLSSTIGLAPLLVSYSVTAPDDMLKGAFYLWTDNGEPVSNGRTGQKFLTEPGTHRMQVLVTTADGKEHRVGQDVTVLERVDDRTSR